MERFVHALSGDLESLVESARFLTLLARLYQQQNRYEDRLTHLSKAKDVQDRYIWALFISSIAKCLHVLNSVLARWSVQLYVLGYFLM